MPAFYERSHTCAACGVVHAVLHWRGDRDGSSHSPVRTKQAFKCGKCGALLFEEDEADCDSTQVIPAEDPLVAKIRADWVSRAGPGDTPASPLSSLIERWWDWIRTPRQVVRLADPRGGLVV